MCTIIIYSFLCRQIFSYICQYMTKERLFFAGHLLLALLGGWFKTAVCITWYDFNIWRLVVLPHWLRESVVCVALSLCHLLVSNNFMQHTWCSFFGAVLMAFKFNLCNRKKQQLCNWWWGSVIHSTVVNGFCFFPSLANLWVEYNQKTKDQDRVCVCCCAGVTWDWCAHSTVKTATAR